MSDLDPGWIGQWLLIVSVVAIVVELALAGIWTARLASRGRALSLRVATEQAQIRADVERLRAALEETRVLWRPYARMLRWLRHPLMIALLQSYRRRRASAR